MGTAEFALVISAIALTVGIGNLVWNIWSKFIQPKPRIRLGFAIMTLAGNDDGIMAKQAIQISAANLGPNDVVISTVVGKSKMSRFPKSQTQHFVMFASSAWPQVHNDGLTDYGKLPTRIAVGDSGQWYLPMNNRYFTESDMTDFGLADTFGRTHWANRKQVGSVREQVLEFLNQDE